MACFIGFFSFSVAYFTCVKVEIFLIYGKSYNLIYKEKQITLFKNKIHTLNKIYNTRIEREDYKQYRNKLTFSL